MLSKKMLPVSKFLKSRLVGPVISQLNNTFYSYSPEPSQPLNREPKIVSVEEAVKCIKSSKDKVQYIITSLNSNLIESGKQG